MPPKRQGGNRALEAQIANLSAQMARLGSEVRRGRAPTRGRGRGRGGRRSRSRSRSRSGALPAAYGGGPSTSGLSRITPARGLGTAVVSGKEAVIGVKIEANKTDWNVIMGPQPNTASYGPEQLNKLSKLYSEYRVLSLTVHYEPVCGTATNGSIVIAISASSDAKIGALTFAKVSGVQPNAAGPLYKPLTLRVPRSFLIQKNWYDCTKEDDEPYEVYAWVDCDSATNARTVGRIWYTYEYEFQGFGDAP